MPHLAEQLHILSDLGVVFFFGSSEFEVDDDIFFAVGYHSVGTQQARLLLLSVVEQQRTLVEHGPTGREPFAHPLVIKSLAQHADELFPFDLVVVEDAIIFQLLQGLVYIGRRTYRREDLVQHIAQLDVLIMIVALIVVSEFDALIALAESRHRLVGLDDWHIHRFGSLAEYIALLGGLLCTSGLALGCGQ